MNLRDTMARVSTLHAIKSSALRAPPTIVSASCRDDIRLPHPYQSTGAAYHLYRNVRIITKRRSVDDRKGMHACSKWKYPNIDSGTTQSGHEFDYEPHSEEYEDRTKS
jgi:hypothetical protein